MQWHQKPAFVLGHLFLTVAGVVATLNVWVVTALLAVGKFILTFFAGVKLDGTKPTAK